MHLHLLILYTLPILLLLLGLRYIFLGNRGRLSNIINTLVIKEYVDPTNSAIIIKYTPTIEPPSPEHYNNHQYNQIKIHHHN